MVIFHNEGVHKRGFREICAKANAFFMNDLEWKMTNEVAKYANDIQLFSLVNMIVTSEQMQLDFKKILFCEDCCLLRWINRRQGRALSTSEAFLLFFK